MLPGNGAPVSGSRTGVGERRRCARAGRAPGRDRWWRCCFASTGTRRRNSGPFEKMRNLQRAAQGRDARHAVIRGLGRVLAGQGKLLRVQRGVVEGDADSAVVQPFPAIAVIAERGQLRERRSGAVVELPLMRKPSAARWLRSSSDGLWRGCRCVRAARVARRVAGLAEPAAAQRCTRRFGSGPGSDRAEAASIPISPRQ